MAVDLLEGSSMIAGIQIPSIYSWPQSLGRGGEETRVLEMKKTTFFRIEVVYLD